MAVTTRPGRYGSILIEKELRMLVEMVRLHGAQAVDFAAVNPGSVGITLEFRSIHERLIGVCLSPEDIEQLADQLDALLDQVAKHRLGSPLTPELWDQSPAIDETEALPEVEASWDDSMRWKLAEEIQP